MSHDDSGAEQDAEGCSEVVVSNVGTPTLEVNPELVRAAKRRLIQIHATKRRPVAVGLPGVTEGGATCRSEDHGAD